MPSYGMVTTEYLKQILRGDKKLMKMADVRQCNPPHYDEISVQELYEPCLKMANMAQYFPDQYPKGRSCSRPYFFAILATLHPDYTDKLIKRSKEMRFGVDGDKQRSEAIEMDPAWQEQLKQFPQFSSKSTSFWSPDVFSPF